MLIAAKLEETRGTETKRQKHLNDPSLSTLQTSTSSFRRPYSARRLVRPFSTVLVHRRRHRVRDEASVLRGGWKSTYEYDVVSCRRAEREGYKQKLSSDEIE